MNFTLHKEEDNNPIELMGAKVITVQKDTLNDSYPKNEFQRAIVIKKRTDGITEIKKAYTVKPGISERKKADLMNLKGAIGLKIFPLVFQGQPTPS